MKSVILTNEEGESLGSENVIDAHIDGGKLHKAFSAFVFTPGRKKLLIQRRASVKMLWPGYWSNTCCSHPRGKFSIEIEAADRLREELGFLCGLEVVGSFIYKADDPEGRGTEYEYDTVLVGETDESVALDPNPNEIMDTEWIEVEKLLQDMEEHPDMYTPWFKEGLTMILSDV